jgi:hypothetical protein
MYCSSCRTQLNASNRNCPNCGRSVRGQNVTLSDTQDPSASSSGVSHSLAKAQTAAKSSLGDSSAKQRSPARSKKKTAKKKSEPELSLATLVESPPGESGMECRISVDQISALIADRPDCLEDGLSIYTDDEKKPAGIAFETEVGLIDLLAKDDAGGLVVVLIAPQMDPKSSAVGKNLVSMALERVGWVRKHVAKNKQEVRAIVLLEHVPEDISYTAAAVAATVGFKTYRSEITFSEVEI